MFSQSKSIEKDLMMYNAAFFSDDPKQIQRVYAGGRQEGLYAELSFFPEIVSSQNFTQHQPALQNLEYIFSTWGMTPLTEEQIGQLPSLKAVFYAAGSVQYFARPFLNKGVQVISAWAANGVPVTQYVVAQLVLAVKGYFTATRLCLTSEGRNGFVNHYPGLFHNTISLLGAGMIGSQVIHMLKPYELNILVFDPFLSQARAADLGVTQVSLEEAFARGFVVSNHIADLPETRGMLTRGLFESMQPYATFINSGRGATIDEAGMLDVMARRPDLTALLDVTFPEPPLPDNPIYRLENVYLSPHIAGSLGNEVLRQADYVIEEYHRLVKGETLRYSVTLEMLKRMA
jgi:phosphoglycerate dehydrogenase-like enzyme